MSSERQNSMPKRLPHPLNAHSSSLSSQLSLRYHSGVDFSGVWYTCELINGFLPLLRTLRILAAIPSTFESAYGFNPGQSHLVLISITIGSVVGFLSNFHQQSLYRRRAARSVNNKCAPEVRLYWTCAGGLLFSIGCLIMAWTTTSEVHFVIPCLFGLVILIWGIYVVYTALFNYLSDCYETYASSAQVSMTI